MAQPRVVLLPWPSTQSNYGFKSHLTPEAQLKVAKERVSFFLDAVAPLKYPGEAITVAFAFGGFTPHG